MAKFKKENWRGQELFTKLGIYSMIVLEIFLFPIINLLEEKPIYGLFILFGLGFYFMGLAYASKSYANKITKTFGGIRRWKVRYDLGRGRTGNTKLFIGDMYPLKKAPKVMQDQVEKAEERMYVVEEKIKLEKGLQIDGLTLLEDTKKKKEEIIADLKNRDINETVKRDYILDKILQPFYETGRKKKAFIKGKASKEFLEWKKTDGNILKALQSAVREEIKELDKKQSQKDIEERRLQLIGEEIALRSTLGEIIAADKKEAEGGAVHAFLKTHFEDYKDLINKHQILDLAQGIAKEIWIPKFVKIVEEVYLKDCVKTVVELFEEASFDHEPHLPFNRAVAYAQEPLEDAVDWKERVPKTIHYFPDIPVTNGYSNIIVPTRITWDTPLIFVAHSPGKDYFVRNLKLDEDDIEEEKIQATSDIIADLEAQIIETDDKAKKFEKSERSFRKIATDYSDKMEILKKFYAKERMTRLDQRPGYQKINIGKTLLYVIIIIVIIFVVFFLVGMGGNLIPINNSTSSLSILPLYLENLNYFGGI